MMHGIDRNSAEPGDQGAMLNIDFSRANKPGFVGDLEFAKNSARMSERGVTLNEKFIFALRLSRRGGNGNIPISPAGKLAVGCNHLAFTFPGFQACLQTSQVIRQAIQPRTDQNGQTIGNPLTEEINSALFAPADIRSQIEKIMIGQRRAKQLREPAADNR